MPSTPPRIIRSLADLGDAQVAQLASRCGGIAPGRVEDVYSCTPMQLDMIREDRAEALHFVVRFGPGADIDRFCAAVRDVVAANAVLRTRLVPLDGDGDGGPEIVQVVLKGEHVTARWTVDRDKSEEDEVNLYLGDGDAEPMGLGRPLFRTVFIGRTFITSVHHAVTDYWSITTLLDVDVASVYFGRDLVARPPFKSFVARSLALDEPAARSFWASRFQGTPAVFPPPAATAHQHRRRRPRILAEPERRIPLPRVADGTVPQSHVPFFVEAAWALTASALSGGESVAYGCVLSGRSPPLPGGLEATLGPALAEVPVQAVLPRRATTVGRLVRDRAAALRELLRQDPALLHCGPARIAQLAGGGVAAARAAAFTALINVRPVAADGTTTAKPDAEAPNGRDSGGGNGGDSIGNGASKAVGRPPHSGAVEAAQDEVKMDRFVWVRGSYPLQLIFTIRADGVSLWTRFDAEAVGRRTLARILAQLGHSLRLLTEAAPETRLDGLLLLHPDAAAEIVRWNDAARTASPRPPDLLHALFEEQVRERPHAAAVSSATEHGAESLTYSALDGRASRLARELCRRFGVRRGSRVGVLLGPSVWAAVAVLGILKAGGVYVPIDVLEGDDEQERRRKMSYLTAAGVRLSLASVSERAKPLGTAQRVLPLRGGQIPGGVILLGELGSPLDVSDGDGDDVEETRAEEEIHPDDPACIVPTSGITGPARAVELTHGNLSWTLAALAQRLGWGPGCRMLQSAPLATGASVIETLGALSFGGCLCAGPTVRSEGDVPRLSTFIASAQVNWAVLNPHILNCLSPDAVPGLRSVLATGDGVTEELRQMWSSHSRRFFVGWGVTEASIISTVAETKNEADKVDGGSTPAAPDSYTSIGQPIGSAVWIVNPSNPDEPVPLGGVGELLVEGPGLAAARRYVNDGGVRATKASFVPAPRWTAASRHKGEADGPRFFFRTGDLGRYDLESAVPSIHLVGRSDNCVVVVGAAQRRSMVHLEQIEAAVSESGLVLEAAVVSRIAAGRTALVAVVALADGQLSPSGDAVPQRTLFPVPGDVAGQRVEAVREYVSSRLPVEQVPSAWLAVERLPRTVSHKIDRAALKRWLKTNETAGVVT
ncbi:hypothetical protein RB595_000159 [Gaeumannomyces hyphopodioides]